MHRPSLNEPAAFLNPVRLTLVMHKSLAFRFRRGQLLAHRPGVAAAAMDVVIIDHRDDARLRQIKQAEGDHLVAGRGIALLQIEKIVGMECGIRIEGFSEYQVGDAIESYSVEKVAAKL